MDTSFSNKVSSYLKAEASVAPLAFFRLVFGLVMFFSMIRFMLKGWVNTLYVQPKFYFTYYGFDWVKPPGEAGMYILFILLALSALGIGLGLFYRYSSWIFFIVFTYVELLDKSNYLNHYYFISIIALLLCLVPAHKKYSLDVRFGFTKQLNLLPRWCSFVFQLQLVILYFYAGIAKINSDWLLNAMPLRLWLPVKYDIPIIGPLLDEIWVAYFFSWAGMLYDVCIPFLLFWRRTVYIAVGLVFIFHVLTAILFPIIGMFPFIMLMAAWIFLPETLHEKLFRKLEWLFPNRDFIYSTAKNHLFSPYKVIYMVLVLHFFIQIIVPLRYLLYPGPLFWTEEGYRFSWRVMLMEKAGYTTFTMVDRPSGTIKEINNGYYLTPQQEKMMSSQPDMILQFAHHIAEIHKKEGLKDPEVYAESYVTINGKPSRRYLDSRVDLTKEKESFAPKKWILPLNEK